MTNLALIGIGFVAGMATVLAAELGLLWLVTRAVGAMEAAEEELL